jgi:hypothetical protein
MEKNHVPGTSIENDLFQLHIFLLIYIGYLVATFN